MKQLILLFGILGAGQSFSQTFSADFSSFLSQHYSDYDFTGDEAVKSGFGGKLLSSDVVKKRPVVFVHGNTDRAVGGYLDGWQQSLSYFQNKGYQASELYALTWGDGRQTSFPLNQHSQAFIRKIRAFFEAVMAYTGADEIDVIAHSMGVTLSRAAIAGIMINKGNLNDQVRHFIGIAGLNKGTQGCVSGSVRFFPMCSKHNGLHPDSDLLDELNRGPVLVGEHVISIWSYDDEIINRSTARQGEGSISSSDTSPIPGQDQEFAYRELGHMQVRDNTVGLQWELVQNAQAAQ